MPPLDALALVASVGFTPGLPPVAGVGPFLWIWAMAYRPERGWGFSHPGPDGVTPATNSSEFEDLRRRVAQLESELKK